MDIELIKEWVALNPWYGLGGAVILFSITFLLARLIFGRGIIYLAARTKTKVDDILVKNVRPLRAAWLAPFIVLNAIASFFPAYQLYIHKVSLFFILWLSVLTINGLVAAANQIYESRPSYAGVSIQGYLDILRLLVLLVGIILSISLFTGKSPVLLLSGLGAIAAVLLLVFHDTILSLVASVQITFQDLVKEGDWLEVPSFDSDGVVTNVSLHFIRIRNWDLTITVIPTAKLMETYFKNWRGMQESGGRRIKRSVFLDQNSISFCTPGMIDRYGRIDLVEGFIARRKVAMEKYAQREKELDSPLDGPQLTNVEVFRAYMEAYLKSHAEIHTKEMDFIIRELAPSPNGLPVEVYAFTKTTDWGKYEQIQAEVFDHLLAAAAFFDLKVYQQPSGADFSKGLGRLEQGIE
jgi:miniconductance mechanosensitive channel